MMNRFARSTLCLLLVGFLGMGSVGKAFCICADGDVELGAGCCDGAPDTDDAPDRHRIPGHAVPASACGEDSADCTYAPLSSGAMLHSSSHASKRAPANRSPFLTACQATGFDGRALGVVRSNASRARFSSIRTSASLLAQRTIVLRI